MAKICLILMDGVRFDTAVEECGYLEAEVEAGHAQRWKMQTCLPTISAAMYETIHTGLAPVEHGILGNESIRPSRCPNVFSALKQSGHVTAAIGHSYFHTLYGGSAFDPFEHAEINDPAAPVPYARHYSMEGYCEANSCVPAEVDLCAQAWSVARQYAPDYLMLHSSSADTLGHWFTANSAEYRKQAWLLDNALSRLIPRLRDVGYEVIVTADHGMNPDGHHGGNQAGLRTVPFYYFGTMSGPAAGEMLDQRGIAPSVLSRIGAMVPKTMLHSSIFAAE